jgi:hypothetical protein
MCALRLLSSSPKALADWFAGYEVQRGESVSRKDRELDAIVSKLEEMAD